MMEIVEKVAAKMVRQAECNHERKATGFGYACRGHYGAYSYCLDCDRTRPLHTRDGNAGGGGIENDMGKAQGDESA